VTTHASERVRIFSSFSGAATAYSTALLFFPFISRLTGFNFSLSNLRAVVCLGCILRNFDCFAVGLRPEKRRRVYVVLVIGCLLLILYSFCFHFFFWGQIWLVMSSLAAWTRCPEAVVKCCPLNLASLDFRQLLIRLCTCFPIPGARPC
jgi:hypothetical protein